MTTPNDDAPAVAAARGIGDHESKPGHSASLADDAQAAKLQSTYAALLALHGGFSLHELAGGSFLICRWGMHHHAADLAGVKAFLARLGVSA